VDVVFSAESWEEYLYWQETDPGTLKRINLLIKDMMRHPYRGMGKPEPLRHALQGYWSRRITSEHRIIYRKAGNQILIAQLRYHYR
jgi:toxin YoeB